MEMQKGRNSSIVCASPAKLFQKRVNRFLCCWVGNPVGGKQEAGKDKRTDFHTGLTEWTNGLTDSMVNLAGY